MPRKGKGKSRRVAAQQMKTEKMLDKLRKVLCSPQEGQRLGNEPGWHGEYRLYIEACEPDGVDKDDRPGMEDYDPHWWDEPDDYRRA